MAVTVCVHFFPYVPLYTSASHGRLTVCRPYAAFFRAYTPTQIDTYTHTQQAVFLADLEPGNRVSKRKREGAGMSRKRCLSGPLTHAYGSFLANISCQFWGFSVN